MEKYINFSAASPAQKTEILTFAKKIKQAHEKGDNATYNELVEQLAVVFKKSANIQLVIRPIRPCCEMARSSTFYFELVSFIESQPAIEKQEKAEKQEK